MPGQTLDALEDYRRADLRLARGRASEIIEHTLRTEPSASGASADDPLGSACFHVCLGRAHAALAATATHASDARLHLDAAIVALRETGDEEALPLGLLPRAEFFIRTGDLAAADTDLTEALAIAQRGEMRNHEADVLFGFARLSLAAATARMAREQCFTNAHLCWLRAMELVSETGDERRRAEASLIEAEIALGRDHGDAALAALEAAAEVISLQRQFALLAKLNELAGSFPSLISTLSRIADERSAFDKEADEQRQVQREQAAPEVDDGGDTDGGDVAVTDGADLSVEVATVLAAPDLHPMADEEGDVHEPRVEDVPRGATAPEVDEDGDTDGADGADLAAQVATVLGDPELRLKTADMLVNPEARAELAQYLSDMDAGSLDDLGPEQQLGAMAAFILSRNDDEDDSDDDDATDATGNDGSDGAVSGQLGAAVEALLGDAHGREMVDGLLQHQGFRQALIAELEESQVPMPLEQLPHDIQRKFAAAFALEKGVISVDRGDETES